MTMIDCHDVVEFANHVFKKLDGHDVLHLGIKTVPKSYMQDHFVSVSIEANRGLASHGQLTTSPFKPGNGNHRNRIMICKDEATRGGEGKSARAPEWPTTQANA